MIFTLLLGITKVDMLLYVFRKKNMSLCWSADWWSLDYRNGNRDLGDCWMGAMIHQVEWEGQSFFIWWVDENSPSILFCLASNYRHSILENCWRAASGKIEIILTSSLKSNNYFIKRGPVAKKRKKLTPPLNIKYLQMVNPSVHLLAHIPLFNRWQELNTFSQFFNLQGKSLLLFKTREQEVSVKAAMFGNGDPWPMAPCLFSSVLRERYLHITPGQWPPVSCLSEEPGKLTFPFTTEYFLVLIFKRPTSCRDVCSGCFLFYNFCFAIL